MLRGAHRLACILATVSSLAACAAPRPDAPASGDETEPAGLNAHVERTEGSAQKARADKRPAPQRHTVIQAPLLIAPVATRTGPEEEADAAFDDLLARMRAGFELPRVENAAVKSHITWYENNPTHLERVLDRARPYLPHVANEVEARGMPMELAFLPVIESAFDPFAYSHGRAAGLWQIIPGTGTRFGLKQNWWYDGRRDVVESTRAALDYLEYLHQLMDGDWLLAVAAYNAGEGTVGRAIRSNQAAGRPTDFWNLRLPAETRAYVPRLLGLSRVLADPEKYSLTLPEIPDTPVFAAVELGSQIDLAVAATLAGLELGELQALNPGFNRWATDPDGPHRLLLPVDAAEPFTLALATLPAAERVRWHRHEVRPGDTLGAIARKYRTTVSTLQSVNNLSGTNIRVGRHLMVPTSTLGTTDYPLSASSRLTSTQERERAGRVRSEHRVRSGESLWSISRKHKVGVRELAAWNGMAPGDTLAVGRTLVVWQHGGPAGNSAITVAASNGPSAGPNAVPNSAPLIRRVNYTVRRGDSLSRIASRFRVTVADIKRWNSLDGARYLQPGQRLVLHVDVTVQSGR